MTQHRGQASSEGASSPGDPATTRASGSPRALVTGASSGIGWAVAERLAAAGWTVTCLARRGSSPPGTTAIAGDAAEPDDLRRALEVTVGADGELHGLVCAAGSPPSGPWDDPGHWTATLRLDLTAPYQACRMAWPALVAGAGSVVLVGSILGADEGSARSPAYAAAKAGLEGLARSLAVLGGEDSVRVNVVAPGAIDTPFDLPAFAPDSRPDVPLGRMGTADEVAAVIEMLLGAGSAYVTGAVWRVDGGRSVLSAVDAARRGADRP
jgi:meso-butanediol dehydrogenase/(S,S)-butanediol dehydrogenase/diacetyl reductase